MDLDKRKRITDTLNGISGMHDASAQGLVPYFYDELRRIASRQLDRENSGHTLQATALVHEAYLKLVQQDQIEFQGRTRFLALCSKTMRNVLVDHARRKKREKRGGCATIVSLDENQPLMIDKADDLLALDEAMKGLEQLDARSAKVLEMRFFAGMQLREIADAVGISLTTVKEDLGMARAWIKKEIVNAAA